MRVGVPTAVLSLALLASACGGSGGTPGVADPGADAAETQVTDAENGETDELSAELESVREATTVYTDPEAAEEAGYQPTEACVTNPEGEGAMGLHYVNPELMQNEALSPTEPAVLVYAPTGEDIELAAVEWVAPDADQDLSTDDDRPSLFGQDFDGPMEGHEPGQPIHYDLHAWLFKDNPDGVFEMWNPDVSCPE